MGKISLVLFYQYVEPPWTEKEHKEALKSVIGLGTKVGIKGRGRCAAEGLNCTLTGPPDVVRAFCNGLREWRPALFNETDFKITDGLEKAHCFKALTIQKKDDLVAYGLPTEVAPALNKSNARHVEADEYHRLMTNPDSVIIDVRNFYESNIGHFQPPPGGAELIDPKMRNSIEFPKWINAPETQAKLNGKQVLMYCTGGIRCERASALLDAMARTSNGKFAVKDTVMVRGGIERYMKTFPEGGYWKGKNYLFDRRLEQVPEAKSETALAADVESYCCVCHQPCGYYRGQFVCGGWLERTQSKCDVPVIVCKACAQHSPDPRELRCPLCEQGYAMPTAKPDLPSLKRALEEKLVEEKSLAGKAAEPGDADEVLSKRAKKAAAAEGELPAAADESASTARVKSKRERQEAKAATCAPSSRVFVGNLPFIVSAADLRAAFLASLRGERPPPPEGTKAAKKWRRAQRLQPPTPATSGQQWTDSIVVAIRWLTDHSSGLFYGSAFVELSSVEVASALVSASADGEAKARGGQPPDGNDGGGIKMRGRRLRVRFSPPNAGEVWPPPRKEQCERPPAGVDEASMRPLPA